MFFALSSESLIAEIVFITSIDGFVTRVVSVTSSSKFPSVLSPSSETSVTSSVPWGELAVAVTWLWIIWASIAAWLTMNLTL